MAETPTIQDLKSVLLAELRSFCSNNGRLWKQPVVELLQGLRGQSAVFFGGTLRSLLISRLVKNRPGRPRDIDLVIRDCSTQQLRESFHRIVTRETRFGGLQLQDKFWHFDVWPLEKTWAFVEDDMKFVEFDLLPQTTFLNLEAIAVEVWPQNGKSRFVYSGDGQFFDGIANRVVEINREKNPFPSLCIVRSLILAARLNFSVGPRLAKYVVEHAAQYSAIDYEAVQKKHYGHLRVHGNQIEHWINAVRDSLCRKESRIVLPVIRQMELWDNFTRLQKIRVSHIGRACKSGA